MDHLPADVRYSEVKWNCPLSEAGADNLLGRLQLSPSTSLVDIGCGWGELLLRAGERYGTAALGVDNNKEHIVRGQKAAGQRNTNVALILMAGQEWCRANQQDSQELPRHDRAICIGASHVFGGTREMLTELAQVVPRGRVLVGDLCWEKPPSQACRDLFGEDILSLRDFAACCGQTGWKLMHLETATQQDWDAFESGLWAGPRTWLLEHPDSDIAQEVGRELEDKENNYFNVYRGELSFVYGILAR